MNPAKVFALMSQRTPNPDAIPGGVSGFDIADASGLCRNMPRHWYLAGRLKWAQDWTVANELEYALWMRTTKLAVAEKWKIKKGALQLRKLAGLAIAETADPANWKTVEKKLSFTEMTDSSWYKRWGKRYEAVFQIIDDQWANAAYQYINSKQELSGKT